MDRQRTVLLVDDDVEALESLQRIIERNGMRCLVAENGVEALQRMRDFPEVQVVVADHDMPAMDGVELLRLIGIRCPHVCRMLLTARRDSETAVRAINLAGAYRWLAKPIRASDLLTTLHFAFEVAEHEAENRSLRQLVGKQSALLAALRKRHPEEGTAIDEVA